MQLQRNRWFEETDGGNPGGPWGTQGGGLGGRLATLGEHWGTLGRPLEILEGAWGPCGGLEEPIGGP